MLSALIARRYRYASVVCEAVVATEVAKAMLEKFDSDSFEQMKEAVKRYRLYTQNF